MVVLVYDIFIICLVVIGVFCLGFGFFWLVAVLAWLRWVWLLGCLVAFTLFVLLTSIILSKTTSERRIKLKSRLMNQTRMRLTEHIKLLLIVMLVITTLN